MVDRSFDVKVIKACILTLLCLIWTDELLASKVFAYEHAERRVQFRF